MSFDIDTVRKRFPALAGDWTFFDNAGGSQVLEDVANRIRGYLLETNVQLGASYEVSVRAAERVQEAQRSLAGLFRAADPSEIVLGPSTSSLLRTLAASIGRTLEPGDEVIVTTSDHEANVGPWVELEERGIVVRYWKLDPDAMTLETEDLERLLSERTRLVTVPHVSNVLGTINPIAEWAALVHARGAQIVVDGVAYAPHRRIDVQAWDVDFYAVSLYKTYGPHLAALFGKREHLLRLPRQNHFFISEDDVPYKFQPGNVNYELAWGAGAIPDYLSGLAGAGGSLEEAFDAIAAHESALGARFLDWLASKPRARVVGQHAMTASRVPTISFVVEGLRSSEIPPRTDAHRIGIRWGDFYARRLVEGLGLESQDGVVRVSMVHYNTIEEVERLIAALDPWI